jgi:hypothetical protein
MFSFERKCWAGSSVWYERRLRKAEAAGSNPARSTGSRALKLADYNYFHGTAINIADKQQKKRKLFLVFA